MTAAKVQACSLGNWLLIRQEE